jgi:hypothetical protein
LDIAKSASKIHNSEINMTLAQVVYQMSTDEDFAAQLLSNPDTTLEKRGLQVSREELAFLVSAHNRGQNGTMRIVSLADQRAKKWGA